VLHLTWLEDNGSGSSLRYAARSGGAWSAPELIPTGAILSNVNADQGPSIATDSAGHPYVLYVGPSQGTFGPTGHTALYGAMQAMEKINGAWTDISPPAVAPPGYLSHTPQIYVRGSDIYAFNGHDTDINFSYARKLGGGAWSSLTKLTTQIADGSASIRWDPLHETDPSIIDATTYDEDRLGDRSFLGEVYYMAVKPSVADTTPPAVSLTAPAAGNVSGTVAVSANASDNVGVAGVTFMLDGSSIAAEDTTSPYSINWDSTTATNGPHTLAAVARDASGNTTTSASVGISVNNVASPPPPAGAVLFGNSSLTPFANADTNVPGAVEAFDVGTVTTGSLARMHVFLDAPLPPTLLVALYADSAGAPATLLSSTSIVTPATGWNDVAFGPVAITAGTHYWVALLTPTGLAGGPHFRVAKSGGAGLFVSAPSLSAFPTTWPAGGTKNVDGPLAAWGSS
jgi:Bacterial Ig domain